MSVRPTHHRTEARQPARMGRGVCRIGGKDIKAPNTPPLGLRGGNSKV
jgi:hypothetical protein